MITAIFPLLAALPSDALQSDRERIERTLAQLTVLQQEVRAGKVPTVEDLAIGRIDRGTLLREFEPGAAIALGMPMPWLRDRLVPSFDVELRMWADRAVSNDSRGESPVLLRLHEIESELRRLAVDQLQLAGVENPLERSATQQAMAEAVATLTDPEPPTSDEPEEAAEVTPSAETSPEVVEALIQAEAFYTAGFWERALLEYRALALPLDREHLDVHYRMADCLLKLERNSQAATLFSQISDLFPESSLGKSAQWNAELARTIAAVYGEATESAKDREQQP